MKTAQNGASAFSAPNRAAALRLSTVLLIGGSLHFIAPKFFDGIIPPALPGNPRRYTQASGTAAIGIATGLAIPRSRRTSALLAAIFFIAVMPAKVQMTVDWLRSPTKSRTAKIGGIIQLFGQIPLVTEAFKARGRRR
ncbi:DoxX family protein [Nocardia goodfellowii]